MTTGVAIALYNGERFLLRQLDSIREQTRKPERVVLCDDGSSDRTVELVRDYIQRYDLEDTWELVINEQNLGYARNFYHAMRLCETDLIFLCDQDDIWKPDKIEKMTQIMQANSQIALLSSKFGIIDAEDRQIHGFLEPKASETGALDCIALRTLMRAYRWPGMIMCVRGVFFRELQADIDPYTIAHDMVFALCAAERNGFYEFDYITAYHRRHGNNVANEEHRIRKLLNLERKLRDMRVYNTMLEDLVASDIPLSAQTRDVLKHRLSLAQAREQAVRTRSLCGLWRVYHNDRGLYLRKISLVCDLWLLCFGKYSKEG